MSKSPSLRSAGTRRPWRRLLQLAIALVGLLLGGTLIAGLLPVPLDVPVEGASSGTPGGGGLRSAFPAMNQPDSNPTTAERVALGRLLFFDPIVSGDNT